MRDFADMLGVEATTVAKWRANLSDLTPRPRTQTILDTAYQQRTTPEDRERFAQIIAEGETAWRNRHQSDHRLAPGASAGLAGVGVPVPRHDGVVGVEGDLEVVARESTEFAEWLTASAGQISVELFADEVSLIGRQFVHAPPRPLITRLRLLRDELRAALQTGPAPALARELLVLGGITVDLLAHVTENLGDGRAAKRHAIAAEEIATRIGHAGLRAWAGGTRALIAEWNGDPETGMRLARHAATLAPTGEPQVRLASIEARCAARLGRAEDAQSAITRAVHAAETPSSDDLTVLGGALRFPLAKMAYYAGSTFRLLGDHDRAQHWALEAITAYEAGPAVQRSYGDEALARADVAIARISTGELDGAAEILTPVLRLPAEQRIQPVLDGLGAVDTALSGAHHANDSTSRQLSEEITMLTASRHTG
ncbi:hypothetical protein [Nocardia puris]|uniref:hypothetical protein n=1 Tax=Nocardia puris TaxID=208602 RepID=UPI0011BF3C2D|nr:hypothetical protein [Nocardia puris]